MVAAADLKSAGITPVRVRVPPPAPVRSELVEILLLKN